MILGQSRTPYSTPAAAHGGFVPKLPNTGFYSHFHPLRQVTHAMVSAPGMYRPPYEPSMGPHGLPDVPMPAPISPAAVAPALPKPGGVSGFGFGSTGGVGGMHTHVSAYRTMRAGFIAPGTMPSGANIRAGVVNAGARVQRMFPFQTAPLPPPPPPPMVAPVPSATHGFGRGGWHPGGHPMHRGMRRRNWFSRMWAPETVAEVAVQQPSCEWVTDSVSGISKQICNGRVTAYKDAQGNILRPGDYA